MCSASVSRALHLIKNVCLNYVQTIREADGWLADRPDRHFRNLRLEFSLPLSQTKFIVVESET